MNRKRVAFGGLGAVFLTGVLAATEFAEHLPPSEPSAYNGQKCDPSSPRFDHHSTKIRKLVESGEFDKGTWRLDAGVYRILGTPFVHTNIELIQEGRPEPVETIDVWSLNDKTGDATLYASDERLAVVLDDCRADNFVVLDDNEVARYTLATGTGAEIFAHFEKMLGPSVQAVKNKMNYTRLPDANNSGETNSNELPIGLIEAAGLAVPQELRGSYHGIYRWAPGGSGNFLTKIQGSAAGGTTFDNLAAMHLGRQQTDLCHEVGAACTKDFTR